ncbi:hypothetical protein BLNAU_22568 [Blattamonas nauphoetae]|uniref:Uncharacterized protein n=1 Tax=Blattamonas nauphoetae TaxID=2049346 RepID=A0ABQ9WSN3_9EUKA|nr:hypothetical protein BLNAU_22568 [Blattamonas nauphoetae]
MNTDAKSLEVNSKHLSHSSDSPLSRPTLLHASMLQCSFKSSGSEPSTPQLRQPLVLSAIGIASDLTSVSHISFTLFLLLLALDQTPHIHSINSDSHHKCDRITHIQHSHLASPCIAPDQASISLLIILFSNVLISQNDVFGGMTDAIRP